MTEKAFRRIALGFAGAEEREHMGHPDFRANGRIFATLHGDGLTGMVKLTPEQQRRFVEEHPDAFSPENGAWGRAGCTRVTLAAASGAGRRGPAKRVRGAGAPGVSEEVLGEAMTLAWQNSAAKPAAKKSRAKPAPRRRSS